MLISAICTKLLLSASLNKGAGAPAVSVIELSGKEDEIWAEPGLPKKQSPIVIMLHTSLIRHFKMHGFIRFKRVKAGVVTFSDKSSADRNSPLVDSHTILPQNSTSPYSHNAEKCLLYLKPR